MKLTKLTLEPKDINNYWKLHSLDYADSLEVKFANFLQEISKLEKWTLTGDPVFQAKLNDFVDASQSWDIVDYSSKSNEILQLMMYMNITQFAYFFHYLDTQFAPLILSLIVESRSAEDSEPAQLLLHRLEIIDKAGHLKHVLSPVRATLLRNLISLDEDDDLEVDI